MFFSFLRHVSFSCSDDAVHMIFIQRQVNYRQLHSGPSLTDTSLEMKTNDLSHCRDYICVYRCEHWMCKLCRAWRGTSFNCQNINMFDHRDWFPLIPWSLPSLLHALQISAPGLLIRLAYHINCADISSVRMKLETGNNLNQNKWVEEVNGCWCLHTIR